VEARSGTFTDLCHSMHFADASKCVNHLASACAIRDPHDIVGIVDQMAANMLGELEQIVLLGILRVGDEAYGVPILEEIAREAKRDITLATVYKTLSRLEEKGFVTSRLGDPTPARGGRRKRYFALTAPGRRALRQSVSALRRMTRGLEPGLELR
jgi:DNA-binding PadR family transcriptional regulator